jgi:hypothetical protein
MSNIIIKDLEVEFITKKVNNYNTMISYFKITDPKLEKKLKPVFKLSETLMKPIWRSGVINGSVPDENGSVMLKAKYSYIEKTIMERNQKFIIDLVLVSYNDPDDRNVIKGYYARLNNMKAIVKETNDIDSD